MSEAWANASTGSLVGSLGSSLGVLVADGVAELLGVLGSVATVVPSSPLHAARTGSAEADRRDAGEGPAVEVGLAVGHGGGAPFRGTPSWRAVPLDRTEPEPTTPLSGGTRTGLTGDSQPGQADFLVAVRFVVVRLVAAFAVVLLGAVFLAGALAAAFLAGARLLGLGCSASRPSSNGLRNWPV